MIMQFWSDSSLYSFCTDFFRLTSWFYISVCWLTNFCGVKAKRGFGFKSEIHEGNKNVGFLNYVFNFYFGACEKGCSFNCIYKILGRS